MCVFGFLMLSVLLRILLNALLTCDLFENLYIVQVEFKKMQSESEILIGTKFMDLGVGRGWCFKYFLNLRSKITESIIFFGLPPLGKFLSPRMELKFSCTLMYMQFIVRS